MFWINHRDISTEREEEMRITKLDDGMITMFKNIPSKSLETICLILIIVMFSSQMVYASDNMMNGNNGSKSRQFFQGKSTQVLLKPR
jgi:hypothetical protein